MKKILCLILSAMMMLSAAVVYAADNGTDTADNADMALLRALGIVCAPEDEMLAPGGEVSKSAFVNCLVNLVTGGEYALDYSSEALKKAEGLGIIVSAADVDSVRPLIADEAVVMAVRVQGYDVAAAESGYPYGYYSIAQQEGLLRGVQLHGNVTYAQMAKLLKNLLAAEHPQIVMEGDGNVLDVKNKRPVLEYYQDIYCVKGLVTANRMTGLYSENGAGKGYVAIDGVRYRDESGTVSAMLGRRVEAYIKSELSGDDVLMAAVDLSKAELAIDAERISRVSDDCRLIEYYETKDSNRTTKAAIAADAAYLLNDILYTGYRKDDFLKEGTTVALVDNDGDGSYDVVKLAYAETMIVSTVSTATQTVYSEYQFAGALSKLDISEYADENVQIYKNGTEANLSVLAAGDVLSVYRAGSGTNGKVSIYAETNAFSGRVTEYNQSEQTVVINGTEYECAALYLLAAEQNLPMARKLTLHATYTIRLDANGKIVSAATLSDDGLLYGYAKQIAGKKKGIDPVAELKIFLSDGTWQIYAFADKVTWNGEIRIKGSEIAENETITAAVPGVIGIGLDGDGNINVLETPMAYYDGIDPARLNTIGEQRYTYRWNGPTWSNHYYMSAATTVFIIPEETEEESAQDSDYRIGSATSGFNNWAYTFTGYNRDEYYMLDMIVHKKKVSSIREATGPYYMVKRVGTSVGENGDVMASVSVSSTTYAGVTFQGEPGLFDALEPGDLIRLHFDSTGMADNCALVVDASSEKVKRLPNDDERDGSASLVTGFVKKTEPSSGRILLDTQEEMAFKTNPSSSVMVYDGNRGRMTVEPFGSIAPGDYLAVCMSGSAVSQVVVYR